ncbi:hypothetical protein N431DRAFT_459346 [Stipitochalara longipes BDJ]|nr:hypothetical protein N431DRAFT_459346 [Stipitochalara longipes BDJ]
MASNPTITALSRTKSLPTPIVRFGPSNPCRIVDCSLNEAGIHHSIGIYKHHNKPQRRKSVPLPFGESNPPDFIWKASKEREEAMARISRDESVEENRSVAIEMAELLQRFCDLHAA